MHDQSKITTKNPLISKETHGFDDSTRKNNFVNTAISYQTAVSGQIGNLFALFQTVVSF